MKKMINIAFVYAILAMISGVFYREFTKFNDFTGATTLSVVHTHLFTLGMIVFLLVALFSARMDLQKIKKFKLFMIIYNSGVILTVIMFIVRGIYQVLGNVLSSGMNGAISGISGLGHMVTAIGLIMLFLSLKEAKEIK